MAVTIGSARIDENGNAHGGAAGDQTGKEVSTQSWYAHSKGWVLLRAKSAEKREKIAACMKAACSNSHIGYDQYQRDSLYNEAKKYDFDVSKVTKNVECDCSALVRVCCAYAGIIVDTSFRTTNEVSVLMKTGAFDKFTDDLHCKKSTNLLRGDILVTKSQGHTVVVLTDGSKASEEAPVTLGYRTLKNGSAGTDVRELQKKLIALGYDVGSCGADGDFGKDTEKAVKLFQARNGLKQDGQYGENTHKALMAAVSDSEEAEQEPAEEPTADPAPEAVVEQPSKAEAEEPAKTAMVEITGDSVNIRKGNGTQYGRITTVNRGAAFEYVAAAANGWNAVVAGGQVGWVSGQYSKVTE